MVRSRQTRWFRSSWLLAVWLCFLTVQAHAWMHFGRQPHRRDARNEVARVDEQWARALTGNDVATMEKLLADDYLGIASNGLVLTRAQQLDRMRMRETSLTRSETSDQKIKMIGASIAIVTSQTELEGTMDGRPMHGRFRSTRVYQRSGGAWRLTRFEATRERGHANDEDENADGVPSAD